MFISRIFFIISAFAGALCDEALDKRINEKAREIVESEGFDLKTLPVHSQVERNHSSCPDVTETVTEYK